MTLRFTATPGAIRAAEELIGRINLALSIANQRTWAPENQRDIAQIRAALRGATIDEIREND